MLCCRNDLSTIGFNQIENEAESYVINVLLIVFLCHAISIEDDSNGVEMLLFSWPRKQLKKIFCLFPFPTFDFTCATYGFYTSTSAEYDVYLVRDANT